MIKLFKTYLNVAVSAMLSVTCWQSAMSKPAYPWPMTFTQPDGSEITVRLRGDERGHFYLSDDGYLLERKANGAFYYANVDASGRTVASALLANDASKRTPAENAYLKTVDMTRVMNTLSSRQNSARISRAPQRGPGLFPGASFPVTGSPKVLVVLVEYQDKGFTLANPYDYFHRLLTERGFSDYDATGSCLDYFIDNSNGQFNPEFDLYGPITLSHNMSYYGGNDWFGNDSNPEQMAIEACQQLDDQMDFSQYDCNNDGYIDNVYIFYAGQGEASAGSPDTVWPHSWEVTSATSTPYYFDGVRLDRYACSNEWEYGEPDGIGTFVHEFSHVMGIPDLYATSYTSAFTPGAWSAMDYGPYNNNGRTPPAYGAFERYALSWVEPTVLDGPNDITLKNVAQNKCCIIPTGKTNEFFLLENRQREGWDAYIPGHGMLIWHIDYDEYTWNSNTVNNSASHQYVDIEEADGTQNEYSRDGDAFPGTSNVTSFTDDTRPSMRTWANKPLNLPITDIREENGVIYFKVAGGLPDVFPVIVTEVTDIKSTSFHMAWTADENASQYYVSVYEKVQNGDRVYTVMADGWNKTNVGLVTEIDVTGLKPQTQYYAVVYSSNGKFDSDPSEEVAILTAEPTFDLYVPEALEASDVLFDSFVANWNWLDGATDYIINVYSREKCGEPTVDVCDFTGGVSAMPEGWVSSTRQTFANAAYSGEAVPALRLGSAEASVTSPTYSDDVVSLTFWHRGSSASELNSIRVLGLINNNFVEITRVDIVNAAGGAITTISDIPAGVRAIRLSYNEVEHKGSVAIDDINISWGIPMVDVALGYYTNYLTGDVCSTIVTDAQPETEYFYYVTGFNGDIYSKPSNTISVTTPSRPSGISDVATVSQVYTVGTQLRVKAAAGASVCIYDITGRLVMAARTDNAGLFTADLGRKGIYIVKINDKASKISL